MNNLKTTNDWFFQLDDLFDENEEFNYRHGGRTEVYYNFGNSDLYFMIRDEFYRDFVRWKDYYNIEDTSFEPKIERVCAMEGIARLPMSYSEDDIRRIVSRELSVHHTEEEIQDFFEKHELKRMYDRSNGLTIYSYEKKK